MFIDNINVILDVVAARIATMSKQREIAGSMFDITLALSERHAITVLC